MGEELRDENPGGRPPLPRSRIDLLVKSYLPSFKQIPVRSGIIKTHPARSEVRGFIYLCNSSFVCQSFASRSDVVVPVKHAKRYYAFFRPALAKIKYCSVSG